MTLERFIEFIRYWQGRHELPFVRAAIEETSPAEISDLPPGLSVDAVLAIARGEMPMPPPAPVSASRAKPAKPVPDVKVEAKPEAPPQRRWTKQRRRSAQQTESGLERASPVPAPIPARPNYEWRGRRSKRAQALVREQLKNGPQLGESVIAAANCADIPERALIAAADALGVRTRKGQWWIPR